MSLIPCSLCRERPPLGVKLSQVTWAWQKPNRERVAYRQRLCISCFAQKVLALGVEHDYTEGLTCPACGIDTEHDMDAVYATAYVPGSGKLSLEWPLCGACALRVRTIAVENAELLEDRAAVVGGQAPEQAPEKLSPWSMLGIVPRG